MNEPLHLLFPAASKGTRLDKWLVEQISTLTRSQITRLFEEGRVLVDGLTPQKSGIKLAGGETITLDLPTVLDDDTPQPEAISLDIIYEDDDVVVINKAAGLVVHPAVGHSGGTVVNALLARYPNLQDPDQPDRPGIVHRLDRDTSGVLIAALHPAAREFLQNQFRKRSTEKFYAALVSGAPATPRGTIEGPIGRHQTQRQRRAVVAGGRPAITHYETIETLGNFTLLRVRPITGRTHQIRVHLEAIGLPVVGDELYGPKRKRIPNFTRHFLHAEQLTIPLPNGTTSTFTAPLTPDLEQVLAELRR